MAGKTDENYFHRWLALKSTKEKSVDLLNAFEMSGYRWFSTIRGYKQVKPITRKHYIIGLTIDFLGLITVLRGFLIILIPNSTIRILLGDLFVGSPAEEIQVSLITMLFTLSSGLKYNGFLVERKGPIRVYQILYHEIRVSKFDRKQFMLTREDDSSLRKGWYLFGRFYFIATPLTCLGIAGWLIFAFTVNPINYSNPINLIATSFWTILTSIIFTLGAYSTIWLYCHNTMFIPFVTLSLNSVQKLGKSIMGHKKTAQGDILKYFAQQNRIYNFIHLCTTDLGTIISYGVLIVSATADFAMFTSIFIGTGSDLFDYIILSVGIMSFGAIVGINVFSAFTTHRVSKQVTVRFGSSKKLVYFLG